MPRISLTFGLTDLIDLLALRLQRDTAPLDMAPHEETAARRAWLTEVMTSNPDGFGSEMDVRDMMSAMPGGY